MTSKQYDILLRRIGIKMGDPITKSEWMNFLMEYHPLQYLLAWSVLLYVSEIYGTQIIKVWQSLVEPCLLFTPNKYFVAIFILLIVAFICLKIRQIKARFVYGQLWINIFVFVSLVYIQVRFHYADRLLPLTGQTYFADAILLVAAINVLLSLYSSFVRFFRMLKACSRAGRLLDDRPFEPSGDTDPLDYYHDAENYVDRIRTLDRDRTWSLAITGSWGQGKTTILNLITRRLEKQGAILVKFNPRHSTDVKLIQDDFFELLKRVAAKYNSALPKLIDQYIDALSLVPQYGGFLKPVWKLFKPGKEVVCKQVKDSIATLPDQLVVVVDDFDRLSYAEIMEVLKLIDANMAFPNVVFLTAFDVEYVSNVFKDQQGKASFADKFFPLQFPVPHRPESYLIRLLESALFRAELKYKYINDNLDNIVEENKQLFLKYLKTPRDIKRYVNALTVETTYLSESEIDIRQFMLLRLMKYASAKEYENLYRKKYLTEKTGITDDHDSWYRVDDDKLEGVLTKDILCALFTTVEQGYGPLDRKIWDKMSFENYFCNDVFNTLRISEIRDVIDNADVNAVREQLIAWNNDKTRPDVEKYLDESARPGRIATYEQLCKYLQFTLCAAMVYYPGKPFWSFARLLYSKNVDELNSRLHFKKDDYIEFIKQVISQSNPEKVTPVLNFLIKQSLGDAEMREPEVEYILSTQSLIELRNKHFKTWSSTWSTFGEEQYRMLIGCVNEKKADGKLVLDESCCKISRSKIFQSPGWYLQNFVRLGMPDSGREDINHIICDPFWCQIIGGPITMYRWLFLKNRRTAGVRVCQNFWELYIANHYEGIYFENQGSVKQKIENELIPEIRQLNELRGIKKEWRKIKLRKKDNALSDEERALLVRITAINLPVSYKDELLGLLSGK